MFEQFLQYLINFIELFENCQLTTAIKYSYIKQSFTQNVNNFVVYLKILEADLEFFTKFQKQNTLLNKLRNKIYKKVIVVSDLSITRDAFVALIARVENATILRNNYRNRFQKSSYKFCFISRNNCFKQKSNKIVSRLDLRNLFQQNRYKDITIFSLQDSSSNNNCTNKIRIYYNCNQQKHISLNCFFFKKKNLQINATVVAKSNISRVTQKILLFRHISEISDNLEN